MAEKVASDIQVYDGLAWKGMVGQKVYDGANWKDFQGVYNGTDWWKQTQYVEYFAEIINPDDVELQNLNTNDTFMGLNVSGVTLRNGLISFDYNGGYLHLDNRVPNVAGVDKIKFVAVEFEPTSVVSRKEYNTVFQLFSDEGHPFLVLMSRRVTTTEMQHYVANNAGDEGFGRILPKETMIMSALLDFETGAFELTHILPNGNVIYPYLATFYFRIILFSLSFWMILMSC